MKQLLIVTICTSLLLGCNSEELTFASKTAPAKENRNGLVINEDNAQELIALLNELDIYTSLPATLSYNETPREASHTNSQCTVSGNLDIETQSDEKSSTSTFRYENCSYVEGYFLDGSYTTISNFEENLSALSIQRRGKLENKINRFATMMRIDVDINGSAELYEIDYRFDFSTNQNSLEGDFIIFTNPTVIWDENNKNRVGSIVIEGAENNTIELLYDNNGINYYLNGLLYMP